MFPFMEEGRSKVVMRTLYPLADLRFHVDALADVNDESDKPLYNLRKRNVTSIIFAKTIDNTAINWRRNA